MDCQKATRMDRLSVKARVAAMFVRRRCFPAAVSEPDSRCRVYSGLEGTIRAERNTERRGAGVGMQSAAWPYSDRGQAGQWGPARRGRVRAKVRGIRVHQRSQWRRCPETRGVYANTYKLECRRRAAVERVSSSPPLSYLCVRWPHTSYATSSPAAKSALKVVLSSTSSRA